MKDSLDQLDKISSKDSSDGVKGDSSLLSMPLMAHFIELRRRLIHCALSFFLFFCVGYYFSNEILSFLAKPLSSLFQNEAGRRFIYTGLTEAFVTHIKIAVFFSMLVSSGFWAFQIWRFVSPGLYRDEQRFVSYFFVFVPILFFLGSLVAYYVVCPCAWRFFLSFETLCGGIPLQFEARISEYIGLTLKLMIVFGIGFQIPVILGVLVFFRLMSVQFLKKNRKYAFLVITVIAAVLTPPDIISPLGLIIPMYGLYELSIGILSRLVKKDLSIT